MLAGSVLVAIGEEGRTLADALVQDRGSENICYFNTRFASNHYANRHPDFLSKTKYLLWDYITVRSHGQLAAIPGTQDWFGPDAQDYYFRYYLGADSRGQGPNVPLIRPMARLACILGYDATLQLIADTIARNGQPSRIVLACSIADTAASATCVDLAYLVRRVLRNAGLAIPVAGLLSISRTLLERGRIDVISAVVNQHLFAHEYLYFSRAQLYDSGFLPEPWAAIQGPPYDHIAVVDDLGAALDGSLSLSESDDVMVYHGAPVERLAEILPPLSLARLAERELAFQMQLSRIFHASIYAEV